MFSYRSLLKESWRITWRHKYLWFLGLFASLVAGGSSWQYQALSQNLNQGIISGSYYKLSNILVINTVVKNFFLGIANLFHQGFWSTLNLLSILLVVIFILSFFVWISISSEAGLINDTKEILENKKKNLKLSFRHSLNIGNHHFWSVFALNLTIRILTAAVFFIISLPLLFLVIENTGLLAIIYVILFVIFVPVSIALYLMTNYIIAYRVIDNLSFVASLEKGTKLFLKNWLVSTEVGVILFIINFLASAALLVVLLVLLLPLIFFALLLNLSWLIFTLIFLAILIIIIFASILTTFEISTWTDLFIRLKGKGVIAKLERMFNYKK